MRQPQIVVFESDGTLAGSLLALANERRWLLRESPQSPACLNLLHTGGPTVLVMKLGRHLVREMTFLDEVHTALPDLPIVAVVDSEDTTLMSLAMELGARFIMQPRPQLLDVVAQLLEVQLPPVSLVQSKSIPIEAIVDEPQS